MNHEVNCQRFHLGHGRSLSKGAQRESGRVGNVDNVNYTMKVVGAGCTDMQVLTAGSIPDGMNYVMERERGRLVPPLDRRNWRAATGL